MEIRNAISRHPGNLVIDCEVNHPEFGWIPFTWSAADEFGIAKDVGKELKSGRIDIALYVPEPEAEEEDPLVVWRRTASISRFQALAVLHQVGLLASVEAYMADPSTDTIARLAWQNAQEFERNSPTVIGIGAEFGLTEEQLDNLFKIGAKIKA